LLTGFEMAKWEVDAGKILFQKFLKLSISRQTIPSSTILTAIIYITCFYCNEGKALLWMENGKKKILPKSKVLNTICIDV
jgi:hypothetical protein